jgi:hypothetical protein
MHNDGTFTDMLQGPEKLHHHAALSGPLKTISQSPGRGHAGTEHSGRNTGHPGFPAASTRVSKRRTAQERVINTAISTTTFLISGQRRGVQLLAEEQQQVSVAEVQATLGLRGPHSHWNQKLRNHLHEIGPMPNLQPISPPPTTGLLLLRRSTKTHTDRP